MIGKSFYNHTTFRTVILAGGTTGKEQSNVEVENGT
jgi:hypothetical protein